MPVCPGSITLLMAPSTLRARGSTASWSLPPIPDISLPSLLAAISSSFSALPINMKVGAQSPMKMPKRSATPADARKATTPAPVLPMLPDTEEEHATLDKWVALGKAALDQVGDRKKA